MALQNGGFTDIATHVRAAADADPLIGSGQGFTLSISGGHPSLARSVYLASRDRMLVFGQLSTAPSTKLIMMLDPDLFGTTSWADNAVGGSFDGGFIVGQINDSGAQRLYQAADGNISTPFQEVDPDTMAIIDSNPYPGLGVNRGSGTVSTAVGFYQIEASVPYRGNYLVFEGITDGGFDDLAGGAGAYPKGLALVRAADANLLANADSDNAFIWVDLNNPVVSGRMTIPGKVGGVGAFSEPSIQGHSFDWGTTYFDPDSDSTFARPKGELVMFSVGEVTDTPDDYFYMRRVDFNPFNVAGGQVRTHGRIIFTSRFPEPDPPAAGFQSGSTPSRWPMYRGLTKQVLLLSGKVPSASVLTPEVNWWLLQKHSRSAVVANITGPIPQSPVFTADTIDMVSRATGDIGEKIQGVSCAFSIRRASSRGEVLAGAKTPTSTSTVANFPIDANAAGDPEGTLVVKAITGGTPTTLVETTDYTVVLATGVITWVTDQSAADSVTADYDHRTNEVSDTNVPGELLNSTAQTDENGEAIVRVRYADDNTLVGRLDVVDVTTS